MARFTEGIRAETGTRDGDPVAPVFDAIDDLDARVRTAEHRYGHAAIGEAWARRQLTRQALMAGLIIAIAATGTALAVTSGRMAELERRSADELRRLDDERASSFSARVEASAARAAFAAVMEANGRAASAEAQLEIVRDKFASMAGKAEGEHRDAIRSIATAPAEQLTLIGKLLRHPNPEVRRSCEALAAAPRETVSKAFAYFTATQTSRP